MTKESYDLNNNGKIDPDERELMLEFKRRELEDQDSKRDNQLRMTWVVLLIMCITTIAVIVQPERMASADAVLMMMYGSLSAVVGAFFGFNALGSSEIKFVGNDFHLNFGMTVGCFCIEPATSKVSYWR